MNLQEILYRVEIIKVIGSTDTQILDLQFDSRKIKKEGLFVAMKGSLDDGHKYIQQAISNGVRAIVLEHIPKFTSPKVTYIQVNDSNAALGVIASNFYNNPSNSIKLIGVTGTNGKTTIVHLLHQLFTLLNTKSGILSTIHNQIFDEIIASTHTTGDALQINQLLRKMIDKGCEYCFMEVSSHAITQARIAGLNFDGVIFTNITHDHLDYHKTFNEYRDVKKSLFDSLSASAFALTNKDDKNGMKMLESTKARKLSYSLSSIADYKCKILENEFNGMLLNIQNIDVWVRLVGRFNAYNILSVYAIAHQFSFSDSDILTGLSMLNTAAGRFECIRSAKNITGIVDYAHTEDALRNVLSTINDIRTQTEELITVVGCGGERDRIKRPLMSAVACNLSNQVILTSDNPRSEDPKLIIEDMIKNLDPNQKKKVLIIIDRKEAIKTACDIAKPQDIVLIAGKGHEKYQEIKGEKIPFDDVKELKKSLNTN